jgi:dipeptidyl aminopeptidase/acylaminoacyl peptidase
MRFSFNIRKFLMRYQLLFIFLTSLFSLSSTATENPPPLEVYANTPEISLMTISPDGTRIAYRTLHNDRKVLLIKDITTGKTLGGASIEEINAQNAYFIDNFRVILKVSEYKKIPGYTGMHTVSAAFIYDLRTKEIRQLLIPGYGVYKGQTNIGDIIGLSADKQSAYMPAYFSDQKGVKINDFGEGPIYTLMKVKLAKKNKPRQLRIGSHDAKDFFVDENGKPLAIERYNENKKQHRVQSYIDGDWVDIFTETTPYRYRSFSGLTPDRKSLVMTMTGENGRRQYFTMSLKDGKISDPIFTRDDADVEHVLTDIQRVVYGVKYSGFKPSYAFFDDKLTKTFAAIQQAMPENSFTMVDHTPDWSKIIYRIEGGEQAGEYILFANNSFSFLASSRSKVSAELVNPVKEYSYNARDGYKIPTLLTYPKGNTSQKLPAVVMPHGGPEAYDRIKFDWLAQYLASRGVLVIQPQFRGSKGFGIEHLRKGRGEWGKKIQDDITDAITSLSKEGQVDPERVCIMGWSYGGYAALAGATFTPELYQCAISINGISDVEEMLAFEKNEHGEQSETYSYWQEVINTKGLDSGFLKSISPINYVEKIQIPILLIHGLRDKVVNFEQSDDFFDALVDENKNVTLIEIAGEGHKFLKNESRIKTLTAIDKFLNNHLL